MRRKRGSKKSSKGARRQQRAANTVIRKKYTKVFLMECEDGSDVYEATVSLIGGRNSSGAPDDTVTLGDVNQDSQLRTDMELYQFFKISGVSVKMFFPMPTSVEDSPV
jgi:hypothetical protein